MNFGFSDSLRFRLERFARGRTFWRRLPEAFGKTPILVTPDARLQYLKPGRAAFDEKLLRLAMDHVREDSVVWDIGANVGVFSLAAASRARSGYVLAIEPDPWLINLLDQSHLHPENRGLRLQTLSAAVASQPGTANLAIANRGRASNYLESFGGRSQTGGVRETRLVPVLTLDLLSHEAPQPTLIKVDVEGAEWAAMQGARNVITQSRPVIAIEVGNTTRDDVTKFLYSLEYELRDLETGMALSLDNNASPNILAFPR